jgi:hypothetical protein
MAIFTIQINYSMMQLNSVVLAVELGNDLVDPKEQDFYFSNAFIFILIDSLKFQNLCLLMSSAYIG